MFNNNKTGEIRYILIFLLGPQFVLWAFCDDNSSKRSNCTLNDCSCTLLFIIIIIQWAIILLMMRLTQ